MGDGHDLARPDLGDGLAINQPDIEVLEHAADRALDLRAFEIRATRARDHGHVNRGPASLDLGGRLEAGFMATHDDDARRCILLEPGAPRRHSHGER
jgi:hypothetical protein